MKPFCFAKNEIIKTNQASIHPLDIGLIRGFAIFDFFRTVGPSPLFLEDYLQRFTNSAKNAHLPLDYGMDELEGIIHELIEKNQLESGGVRMVLTGGISENFFSPAKGDLFIFCEPLKLPSDEKYANGVKLVSAEYVRPIPKIKTTNYTLPCLLSVDWKKQGAEDVIYHHNGIISESSRSNVFIIKDGEVSTPAKDILEGITRKKVIGLLDNVSIRDITFEELLLADEVFITSTTKRILPITQVDNTLIGSGKPGKKTKELMIAFEKMESSLMPNQL